MLNTNQEFTSVDEKRLEPADEDSTFYLACETLDCIEIKTLTTKISS